MCRALTALRRLVLRHHLPQTVIPHHVLHRVEPTGDTLCLEDKDIQFTIGGIGIGKESDTTLQRAAIADEDRKSTRLNSSHVSISYAVFCLKKKKKHNV